MKKTLLILMTLFTAVIGYSQTFTDVNFIEYTIIPSTNTVEVTDYDYVNGGATVNIPATVDYNSTTYNVTEIGDEAFLAFGSTEKITSVIIPDGVTFIGNRAFQGNLLTTVTIPDSVTQLSNLCFAENPSLMSVILSNNLTDIALFSFFSCGLTSITIPDNVMSIGNLAFANNQLTSVTIPSNVSSIGIQGFKGNPLTCVISESMTPPTIVSPQGGNTSTDTFEGSRGNIDLSIPTGTLGTYVTDSGALWTGFNSVTEGLTGFFTVNNITYTVTSTINNTVRTSGYNVAGGTVVNIPATVSRGCETYDVTEVGSFFQKDLTSVTIPNSVTVISSSAFLNNPNLESAPLHNGITSIGTNAFNNCNLTSVNIPTSMTIIENATFGGNNIASVTIPDNITSLGTAAFQNNNITNVVLSNSLTSIGNFAFENNNISSVSFPNTLTNIGQGAFMNNDLTTLSIPNGITDIPESAFLQNNIASVTIPDSVISIGSTAFRTNQLTTVTIPSSVTNIGDRAFNNNPFTDVTSLALVPPTIITTGDFMDTFASNRGNIHLHIPTGASVLDAYVNGAGALWTGFNPVTQDASLSTSNFELDNDIKVVSTIDGLEIKASNTIKLENYTIYNISGLTIKEGKENTINVNSLSNGIYILKLDFDRGTVTKKILVK